MLNLRSVRPIAVLLFAALLAACDNNDQAMPEAPPQEVGVVQLESGPVYLLETLPGRLEASRVAEVRARVSGIVESREFVEGSDVSAGDVLFRIDDAPYQARRDAAAAQKARAEAMLFEAEYQAERYQRLRDDNAVSEQDLIRAQAQLKQASAELQAAEAELDSARIDLQYTRVTAPVSGRIGRGFVTEGALVSQSEATPMALIQQTDPMYADLQQGSRQQLQRALAAASGSLQLQAEDTLEVELRLDDGPAYPHKGRLLFRDINVDRGTGQRTLRVEVPNPDGLLLPGMFVQAQLAEVRLDKAWLVPQQAVMRGGGHDQLWIVDEDNIIQARDVSIAGSKGNNWVVTDGLEDSVVLMIDGFQKAGPDSEITPVSPDDNDKQGE